MHRIGYAFCAEPGEPKRGAAGDAADRRAWFLWGDRLLPLREGENMVGRDPESDVWVDVGGVSRRHARVTLMDEMATIEDLGSKNGTFVNDGRAEAARPLTDGDRVRLGPIALEFRTRSGAGATETIRFTPG